MSTNLDPMPTKAFHLPELLDLIGNDFNTQDLLSCVQVCRVWNQHFIPVLWATIDDKLYSWSTILWRFSSPSPASIRDDNPSLNNVFTTHGKHIRHLTAGWAVTITTASIAGTVTGLESLTVFESAGLDSELGFRVQGTTPLWTSPLLQDFLPPITRSCNHRCVSVWNFVQRFWSLVIHNLSLKSIEMAQGCQLEDFPIPVPSLLKVLATLPNLTRLVNNMAAIDLQLVLECLPNLSFYSSPIGWVNYRSTTNNLQLTTVFPQLRTLLFRTIVHSIHPVQPSLQHTAILNLLRHLPNLGRLSFDGILAFVDPPPGSTATNSRVRPNSKTTNNSSSSVQAFHFAYHGRVSSSAMRDFIALDILPRMSRLTKLSLQTLTQEAGVTLGKYCPQLEWLQLRTTKYDTKDKDSITPLLHHCSQLKHLDAIWHTVEAYSLVKKPVICRGMEVFRCQITGIGEEEEEEEGYDDDLQDENWEKPVEDDSDDEVEVEEEDEETMTAIRQERLQGYFQYIYDELGRWTELRILELGVDNVDWYDIMGSDPGRHLVDGRIYYNYFGPTPNTLPLSLESGLERLRSLIKLEVIGFEGVDHRINTEELAWMAECWPQLQVMHGFQAPDEKDEFALRCPKVKELREYMQELRPLVRHELGRT
ncbi:hypothetical protein BGZ47_005888 [Haplosporangium gracile]|nr:hypothetical protein BGZ47_005888 [Haplosporangium gracile]